MELYCLSLKHNFYADKCKTERLFEYLYAEALLLTYKPRSRIEVELEVCCKQILM